VSFALTVLRASGKRLVKHYDANGKKYGYDRVDEFQVLQFPVAGFTDFVAALSAVEQRRDTCIIRGQPGPWCNLERSAYRLLHP
jgi:hypothetical protein